MKTSSKRNTKSNRNQKNRRRRWLIIVGWLSGLGGAGALAVAGFFYYLSLDLPAIGPLLEGYDPPQTTTIVAADGTVIGELFIERREVVAQKEIPAVVKNAVIAAEDADFRQHGGIDYMGIARAVWRNIASGRLSQGASTITQQVARAFYLSRKKTFARKIREVLLTRKIEQELSKDSILFLYLNEINFGHACYGIGAAAKYYFNKTVDQLTLAEAALLAGIPKGPAIYEPIGHPKKAARRRAYVIGQMKKHGLISAAEAQLALDSPVVVRRDPRARLRAPEIVSQVIGELSGVLTVDELKRGGYTITTTVDASLQQQARDALRTGLAEIDKRHSRVAPFKKRPWPRTARRKGTLTVGQVIHGEVVGTDDQAGTVELSVLGKAMEVDVRGATRYNPDGLPPSKMAQLGAKLRIRVIEVPDQGPARGELAIGPKGAVVVLDVRTGAVLAMVGDDEIRPGGFNRATMARRQPGSAFKPFVYLAAIRSGAFTPASLLDDSAVVDGEWIPRDAHSGGLQGQVSMRMALAHSLNLPAVKLIRKVGPSTVVALAHELGISSPLEATGALALGASGVSPFEMAIAYNTLAAGGRRIDPHVVSKVTDSRGRQVPLLGRVGKQVVVPSEAFVITSMMRSVVTEGTGRAAGRLGFEVAGKTGTTNQARDAWFVGYSSRVTTAVFVGYDTPRSIGRKEYGARAALPIWVAVMKAAHGKTGAPPFEPPEGVVERQIDPKSGLLAYDGMDGAITEVFVEGTEPTEEATPQDVVSLDGFMTAQVGDDEDDDEDESVQSDGRAPADQRAVDSSVVDE